MLLSDDGRANALNITKPPTMSNFPLARHGSSMPRDYDEMDEPEVFAAQGRFIVHAHGMRDHNFHEV